MLNTGIGTAIVGQEPFFAGQHEIRDLKQGPDGWIYMISLNDEGRSTASTLS